ncbi:hypothetical protein EWM64_g2695 [Hericium alpestre]|uniref:Uncharacterized protein n=1 Tax=Hericium alpestre TaxID=135208 RepID=A0A4Z0A2P3_9AGAM|nr:hypothetical protein EWM64_g2695 [Hericium alpestre]
MSSLATNTTSMRSLTGGLPNAHQDTFPSILFLVLFGATSLLCLFRLVRTYRTPTRLLLTFVRMQLFELVRIATFIVRLLGIADYRAVSDGTGTFNTTLLTVEQVLLSVGYLMPASTLVKLAGYHSSRNEGGDIVGGREAEYNAGDGARADGCDRTRNCCGDERQQGPDGFNGGAEREDGANGLGSHRDGRASPSGTLLREGVAFQGHTRVDLGVAWRNESCVGHPPADSNSTGAKAAFYILQVTVEWLVGASLLVIDAKAWCGVQDAAYMNTYRDEEAHKLAYTSGSY